MESALQNSVQEWRRFLKHSSSGRRFRDRYHRRQQAGRDRSTPRRACYVALGVAIALGSLFLAPLPGPGWGTFFVGLGMVAGEVLQVAGLLDRAEVSLKEALRGVFRSHPRSRSRTDEASTPSLSLVQEQRT